MDRRLLFMAALAVAGGLLVVLLIAQPRPAGEPAPDAGPPAATREGAPIAEGNLRRATTALELAIFEASDAGAPPLALVKGAAAAESIVVHVLRETQPGGVVPSVVVSRRPTSGYLPPPPESLDAVGRGLTQEDGTALAASTHALVLTFIVPTGDGSLRETYRLVERLARERGGYVWDDATGECFTPAAWRAERVDAFVDGVPDVMRQVAVLNVPGEGGHTSYTRGLTKLGLPELVVQEVPAPEARRAWLLLHATAQSLVQRPLVGAGGRYEVDLTQLAKTTLSTGALFRVRRSAQRRAEVVLVRGPPPPTRGGRPTVAIQAPAGALDALFGAPTAVEALLDSGEIEAAKERARERLGALKTERKEGETLLVKLPPGAGGAGGWLEVASWEGAIIRGRFSGGGGVPSTPPTGTELEVNEAQVIDYLLRRPDGTEEGDETGRLMRQAQAKDAAR